MKCFAPSSRGPAVFGRGQYASVVAAVPNVARMSTLAACTAFAASAPLMLLSAATEGPMRETYDGERDAQGRPHGFGKVRMLMC